MKSASTAGLTATVLYLLVVTGAIVGGFRTLKAMNTVAITEKNPEKNAAPGCTPDGTGYLRARLRGDSDLDLNWSDAQMHCDGGPRPDDSGVRVTFAADAPGGGGIRLVFGITTDPATPEARDVPVNVTVIFEAQQKLYSTAGDSRCTIDDYQQRPVLKDGSSTWQRLEAHGFCTAPATVLNGSEALLLDRFDFAGIVHEDAR